MPKTRKIGHYQFEIISILRDEPLHGYEILNRLEKKRGQRPPSGSLYVTLNALEKKGLIKHKLQRGLGPKRKVYYIISENNTK